MPALLFWEISELKPSPTTNLPWARTLYFHCFTGFFLVITCLSANLFIRLLIHLRVQNLFKASCSVFSPWHSPNQSCSLYTYWMSEYSFTIPSVYFLGSLVAQMVKTKVFLQCRRPGFNPWVGKLPLQYSCLENSMGRGVQWATAHRVTKSQTHLSDQHFYFTLGLCLLCLKQLCISQNHKNLLFDFSLTFPG